MAGNLAQNLASSTSNVHITWMNWFLAALVPGLVSLIVVPLLFIKFIHQLLKRHQMLKLG